MAHKMLSRRQSPWNSQTPGVNVRGSKTWSRRRRALVTTSILVFVVSCLSLYLRPHVITRHLDAILPVASQTNEEVFLASRSACNRVHDTVLYEIKAQQELSIHAFDANGRPIVMHGAGIDPSTPVCFIVAVPQKRSAGYTDVPINPKGPDDVHLFVNSSAVAIDFLPLEPWHPLAELREYFGACMEPELDTLPKKYDCWRRHYNRMTNREGPKVVLYYATAVLIHPGVYEMHAEVEMSHYRWAHQWFDDVDHNVTRYPTGLEIPFRSYEERIDETLRQLDSPQVDASVMEVNKYPRVIKVRDGSAAKRLQAAYHARPFCEGKATAAQGRWLSRTHFPDYPATLYDEHGFIWDGDMCKIDWYGIEDISRCTANTTLYMYGDSNVRRVMKSILSGQTYCQDPMEKCQTNDIADRPPLITLAPTSDGDYKVAVDSAQESLAPKDTANNWGFVEWTFGDNAKIEFGFTRSLAYSPRDWTRRLYDKQALPTEELHIVDNKTSPRADTDHVFQPGLDVLFGERPRPPSVNAEYPPANMVVVGAPAWDFAFDFHFYDYEVTLPRYANAVLEAYRDTPIVLLLSHGYCCHEKRTDFRRFSGMRVSYFNDLFVKAFKAGIDDGRVSVVDPRLLGGRPDVFKSYDTDLSGQIRFPYVNIISQMLLNSICIREDGAGTDSAPTLRTYIAA